MSDPLTPLPLNYVAADDARPRRTFPAMWFLAACAVAGVASAILGVLAPKYDENFKAMAIPLPVSTRILLLFSRWFRADFGWIAVWTAPVLLATLLMLRRPRVTDLPPRRRGRLPLRLAFFLIALMVGATIIALMLPMIDLIDSLENPPKH